MQVEEIDENSELIQQPVNSSMSQRSMNKSNIERMQDAISSKSGSVLTNKSQFDSKPMKPMEIAKKFVQQES